MGTGVQLEPPPITDESGGFGLWGFWWDALAQGEACGWVDWGGDLGHENVQATAESGTILARGAGPAAGGGGVVVVG